MKLELYIENEYYLPKKRRNLKSKNKKVKTVSLYIKNFDTKNRATKINKLSCFDRNL